MTQTKRIMADASVKCLCKWQDGSWLCDIVLVFFTGQEDLPGGNSAIISRLVILNLKKGFLLESVDIVRYVQASALLVLSVVRLNTSSGEKQHQFVT